MRVVMADGHSFENESYDLIRDYLRERGIDFRVEQCRSEDEIIARCDDADGILTVYAQMTARVIASLPRCKVYVRCGIGFDAIDVEAASRQGAAACNIPDYCIREVAAHTLAMILDFERKITLLDRSVRRGKWNANEYFPSRRLASLTVGLIGFGSIARETARVVRAIGMTPIAYDPFVEDGVFASHGVERAPFEVVLERSDYVSIHVPLTPDTHHLIDAKALARMKPDAVLVNTARGSIVDQRALFEALRGGRLRGACLDVLEKEPPDLDDDILSLPNVLITPHAAFSGRESYRDLLMRVAETAAQVLYGELPPNVLNRQALESRRPEK